MTINIDSVRGMCLANHKITQISTRKYGGRIYNANISPVSCMYYHLLVSISWNLVVLSHQLNTYGGIDANDLEYNNDQSVNGAIRMHVS